MEETQEIWKPIKGYEGLYEVSNLGRVKSVMCYIRHSSGKTFAKHKGVILKPHLLKKYLAVTIYNQNGQSNKTIHRLVANAFIPNPNNLPQVNHKDENRFNNRADNLEWCSAKYNINYGTGIERRSRTMGKKVRCVETGVVYYSLGEAQRQTKINYRNIHSVCIGLRHTAGGYHWEIVETDG